MKSTRGRHIQDAIKIAIIVASSPACYQENTKDTSLDLGDVPYQVAILGVDGEGGTTVDFGTVALNQATELVVLVANIGAYDATQIEITQELSDPFAFKDGTYPGTGGTCEDEIEEDDVCTLVLTVTPTSHGTYEVAPGLTLNYYNGIMAYDLELTVKATTSAELSLDVASPHDWGNVAVASSNDLTVTLSNSGTATLTTLTEDVAQALAAPFTFKGGSFPGTGGTCSADANNSELASGESCTIVLNFTPAAPGTFSDTLALSFDNGFETTSVTLSLAGHTPGFLEIHENPDTFDFGNVSTVSNSDATFTLENSGGEPITGLAEQVGQELSAPFSFLNDPFNPATGSCTDSLAAGATCTVEVRFAPPLVMHYSDTITLDYHDGTANQTLTQQLDGDGQ